jgi:nucleotide-binding universal stress UspA family protein
MMPPELILVPIDFSESSQQSLDVATDMASRLGSVLLLVHIVPAIPDLPKGVSIFTEGEYDSELHQTAAKQLSDLATGLETKNLNVRTEVGTVDDPRGTRFDIARRGEETSGAAPLRWT